MANTEDILHWSCGHPWIILTTSVSNGKSPRGGCSGEGEYTTQGSQNEYPALAEAKTHNSRRRNRTILPERRIQPTCKCKQQRNPLLENKSNDGNSNPDNHHNVPEPIAAPAQHGVFPGDALKQPNQQVKKSQLRAIQWRLRRQLKDAPQQEKIGIHVLLDDIKQEILDFSRAENHRKLRNKKSKTGESFYRDPYTIVKKLFTTT